MPPWAELKQWNGANTTRILRALRIHKKLMLVENEVSRALGNMILAVMVMLLFGKNFDSYTDESCLFEIYN